MMKYRMENKGHFRIIGIRETMSPNEKRIFVPRINQTTRENFRQYLKQLSGKRVNEVLYIAVKQWEELSDYYMGVETSTKFPHPLPDSLVEVEIPMQTWAVFELPSLSYSVIDNIWYHLFTEWFPDHGYELAENAHFFREINDIHRYELWVPIIKKKSPLMERNIQENHAI